MLAGPRVTHEGKEPQDALDPLVPQDSVTAQLVAASTAQNRAAKLDGELVRQEAELRDAGER